ncbi:MAG: hypothetical protein ABID45_02320 [Patescibacteria group bacterium]
MTNKKSGILFISFILIVGLILVLYFIFWNQTDQEILNTNTNNNLNVNNNKNTNIEVNENTNESVSVPNTETFEFTLNDQEVILSEEFAEDMYIHDFDEENSLTIMSTDLEGIAKESLSITDEEEIIIDGQTGVKLTGGNMKDGSTEYIVLVEYNDWLYHFTGDEDFLDDLANNFEFTN